MSDQINEGDMGVACNTHDKFTGPTKFRSENLKGKDHLQDLDLSLDKRTVLPMISKKQIGCIWLRIDTSGGI
jgi:hypothetical protein